MLLDYYYTIKQVAIRDRCLGITYYALCALICIYCGVAVFLHQGYLEWENAPLFTLRTNLKEAPSQLAQEGPAYCGQVKDGCRVFDKYEIEYPPGKDDSLFLTTYAEDDYQEATGEPGKKWRKVRRDEYYVMAPETYSLKMFHSYLATTFHKDGQRDSSLQGNDMVGFLHADGRVGDVLEVWERERAIEVSVEKILKSAGVVLDEASNVTGHESESVRMRGAFMYFTITYSNINEEGLVPPYYRIHAVRVPDVDYKVNELLSQDSASRVIRRRYGIYVKFVQRAEIARFSFPALLFQLLSGLGLLQIATTFVDLLAIYLVPLKDYYMNAKYTVKSVQLDKGILQKEPMTPIPSPSPTTKPKSE